MRKKCNWVLGERRKNGTQRERERERERCPETGFQSKEVEDGERDISVIALEAEFCARFAERAAAFQFMHL